MLSRLSRYLSRSKRSKNKSKPLPGVLPQVSLHATSHERPPSSWSGHSSGCSIQPDHAPSFLEVVCNDSQPVYCMETVPFYNTSSSLPPGMRKANSLYESAHEGILRERMRVTEIEGERHRDRRVRMVPGVQQDVGTYLPDRTSSQRWNTLEQTDPPSRRSNQLEVQHYDEEKSGDQYTYTDHFVGTHLYRDPSINSARSTQTARKTPSNHPSDYMDPDHYPMKSRYQPQPHPLHLQPPTHSGPFRSLTPQAKQELVQGTHLPPLQYQRDSIPAELFTRESSIRQGPYHLFQQQTPNSPYDHPDLYDIIRRGPLRNFMDDVSGVPMTRVTRLKQPARTFGREDGVSSDVGIGLGRISGMAASRTASLRSRRGTQSDIGVGRRHPSTRIPRQPFRRQGHVIKVVPSQTLLTQTPSSQVPHMSSTDKENIPPTIRRQSTRTAPRTPPHVIKIGKPIGRYKTSTMPVYHLMTPESDTESDTSEPKLLPPIDFVPSSSGLLANVTTREIDRTSKWLEDIVKFTMSPQDDTKSDRSLERKNTINVKRHRVFSTSVDIQSRDVKPATPPTVKEDVKRAKAGRTDLGDEQSSSWIASEIFSIAQNQAAELALGKKYDERIRKLDEEGMKTADNVMAYDGYDDIESLIGDYFEDIKERGSDCGDD
jgi:hypothetical protein